MAFNPAGNNNAQPTAVGNNTEKWKSDAFLNFYLPGPDGSPVKLGDTGVGLKKRKPREDKLITWLNSLDPNMTLEQKLEHLKSKLVITYSVAEVKDDAFDLGI